ncbi:MAG: hypothetical protein L3J59_07335 [Methylococcaceae bacterium]|nr:hypothetical protein [Methylococcaceae bacterium]
MVSLLRYSRLACFIFCSSFSVLTFAGFDAAPNCGGNYQIPDNQWRQISLPCYHNEITTVSGIFGDDIPGTYGIDWSLFRFDATNNQYVELALTDELVLGVGYWILQISGIEQTLDMPTGSEPLRDEDDFFIELITKPIARQWNMVGYPYSTDKPLSDLRILTVTYTESCIGSNFIINSNFLIVCALDLDTANNENIIYNQIWNFNGESYEMVNTNNDFNSWKGYWVLTLESADDISPRIFFPGFNNRKGSRVLK